MKLSSLTIYIIGIAVAISALSYGFFREWMPNQQEIGFLEKNFAELEEQANLKGAAERRVKNAEELVNTEAAKWNQYVARHTPSSDLASGGINLAVNAWQLQIDVRRFRNSIQLDLNRQLKRGGVRVINGPLVPLTDATGPANQILANYFNHPPLAFPVVIFDLGTVTVEGTYDQIMSHVRAYRTFPKYLAVAHGLNLTGTSPVLRGTYQLSMVGYIRGKEVYPSVPEGGSAGGAGGGLAPAGGPTGGPPTGSAPFRGGAGGAGGGGRGPAARGDGEED